MRSTISSGAALLPLLIVIGCSSSQKSARSSEAGAEGTLRPDLSAPVADDTAIAMIRRLESDPLGKDAGTLRGTVFAWVVAADRLQGFSASTAPVDQFNGSAHPYKDELMMQYLFGAASHAAGSAPDAGDSIERQAAGIRSMIAAYRNMLQSDSSLRDLFLDYLDDIRRRGELRSYIQRFGR